MFHLSGQRKEAYAVIAIVSSECCRVPIVHSRRLDNRVTRSNLRDKVRDLDFLSFMTVLQFKVESTADSYSLWRIRFGPATIERLF